MAIYRKQDAFSNLSRLGWMGLSDVTSTKSCFRTSCVQPFFAKDCVVYCVVIRCYF